MHNTNVAAVSRRNPGCGTWARKLVPTCSEREMAHALSWKMNMGTFYINGKRYSYMVSRKERGMSSYNFAFAPASRLGRTFFSPSQVNGLSVKNFSRLTIISALRL